MDKYKAFWPIPNTHHRAPLRTLAADAIGDLHRMLDRDGLTITGSPRWWVSRGIDTPGAAYYDLILVCETNVTRTSVPRRQRISKLARAACG